MKSFSILSAFCFYATSFFAQNAFTQLPNFDGGRRDDGVGFSANGQLYFCCGRDSMHHDKNDVWKLDLVTEHWQEVTALPAAERQYSCSFSSGSNGYVFGGIAYGPTFLNDLWRFDGTATTWTKCADMPRDGLASAIGLVYHGDGYILFGRNGTELSNELWQYSPQSDSWQLASVFPASSRYEAVGFVIGNTLFTGLGRDKDGNLLADFWSYNFETKQWQQLDDFPGGKLFYSYALAVQQKGFVFSGEKDDGTYFNHLWEFSPSTFAWQDLDEFATPVRGVSAWPLKDGFLMATGLKTGFERSYEVWKFEIETTTPKLTVFPNPTTASFELFTSTAFGQAKRISVVGLTGLIVTELAGPFDTYVVDVKVERIPSGVYVLLAENYEGEVVTAKLVIE